MSTTYSNASEANAAIDKTLAALTKDAAKRTGDTATGTFTEIGKTLGALAQNPVFKDDIEFKMLVRRLIDIEDMDVFYERVIALETYVKRVAEAHGVEHVVTSANGPRTLSMAQMPDHMSELEESSDPRKRLEVR